MRRVFIRTVSLAFVDAVCCTMIVFFRDISILIRASYKIASRSYIIPLGRGYTAQNRDEAPEFYKIALSETGSKVKRVDGCFGQRTRQKQKDRRRSDS
jgi:hypothetical protein